MRILSTVVIFLLSITILPLNAATQSNAQKFKQAQEYMEKKDYTKALPLLTEVVSTDQKNPDALNALGIIYQQLGKNDDALKYYLMTINLDNKHKSANQHLGEIYLLKGDLPKAKERLLILEKTCPKNCIETKTLKEKVEGFSRDGNQTYQVNEMN